MLNKTTLMVTFLTALSPSVAAAQCAMASTGAGCVSVPQSAAAPRPSPVEIGSYLTRGEHSIMMNAGYYGFPPVRDGWVYIRIEDDVYRVDFSSFEVLEQVTYQANYYFR
ncbi:hypothetical protein DS901_07735 [Loktanella sp. D2R18]|uniref:hypothetical protein n=1 Tax=Rhodobacterales TaxID=204455 RepID=UPI000DE990D3|nr:MULTISPECIES: hypothetical protein [Rhodobacterales]MDO6589661.1 hypothetical protein [Yoonia sp. 1_MG-2023]RBW44290.1 hypothetical protein DS901_07735 [Loktanella sp. D2R18]